MPAPNVPQDIIDRIKVLERQVRELSGRVSLRPAVTTVVDSQGNAILTGDALGGVGTLWMPIGTPQPLNRDGWGLTTSATFETILRSFVGLHQPKVFLEVIQAFQSGTGSGQIRVMFNGVPVVEPAVDTAVNGVYDVPGWSYDGTPVATTIEVQAKRVSGTGTYAASVRSIHGRPS